MSQDIPNILTTFLPAVDIVNNFVIFNSSVCPYLVWTNQCIWCCKAMDNFISPFSSTSWDTQIQFEVRTSQKIILKPVQTFVFHATSHPSVMSFPPCKWLSAAIDLFKGKNPKKEIGKHQFSVLDWSTQFWIWFFETWSIQISSKSVVKLVITMTNNTFSSLLINLIITLSVMQCFALALSSVHCVAFKFKASICQTWRLCKASLPNKGRQSTVG